MTYNVTLGAALLAAIGGTAIAGQSNTVGDTSGFLADYAAIYGDAGLNQVNWHTGLAGTDFNSNSNTSSASFVFSSLPGAVDSTNGGFMVHIDTTQDNSFSDTGGDFYFGDTNTLRNIDFDAGDDPRPSAADNSLAVAFGNSSWTSNQLEMLFDPGVTAFGFSYEDIGDVGGTLEVLFSDGTTETITTSGSNNDPDRDGFMWAVADAGTTITSIHLTQTFGGGDPSDGFIFYDFATIQVVPLPPAALAGLGLIAGIGAVRRLRRS